MRKILVLSLCLILALSLGLAGTGLLRAHAQTAVSVDVTPPDISRFPRISALLDVFDQQGVFVTDLTENDVKVLENGEEIEVTSLMALQPGVQFVVAINPGPPFAIRDAGGISRYDLLADALRKWASGLQASRKDDLSLVAAGGIGSTHLDAPAWLASFIAYQPASRTAIPGLEALSRAIDVATEPGRAPGMKRAILFITPVIDQGALPALKDLTDRAVQSKVRIYVWLVTPIGGFNTPGGLALQSFASQTGGDIFAFSGAEALPDIETYLAPLRHGYALSYTSNLITSGEHTFSVQVKVDDTLVESNTHPLILKIDPPNPILVSPPTEIMRRSLTEEYDPNNLVPSQQTIEILVEFTDGHNRPLLRSLLYVDGEVVDENIAEPFERFIWDLSAYTASGEHVIQVEAEDSLGLKKVSLPHRIQVTIVPPEGGPLGQLSRGTLVVAGAAILFAGGIVILILILGGRLRIPWLAARRRSRELYSDPVTQPVNSQPTAPSKKDKPARMSWLQRARVPAAPAYLVHLTSAGEPASTPPIPLSTKEMTFGTNPVQATHVLNHPSVSALHTRLHQDEDGNFLIFDQGSVAGTWVNYDPVSRDGRQLEHGDLIHIGQLMFRFAMRRPSAPEKTAVEKSKKP